MFGGGSDVNGSMTLSSGTGSGSKQKSYELVLEVILQCLVVEVMSMVA